ncbi:uncharacterized protein LOC128678250 isoform X2 [Plodia interpunctella]|uniref:uncharacterized protein LOC128678250 isoform X2 n=1 Tax=Plodia interpunctella TaxID=58824 RepID=UPI002367B837|nr:uncharacterized protein LOC128678250 isoform X2 [Plodia interpunctella]
MADFRVFFGVFMCVQLVFCQFGFFVNREERSQGPNFNIPNLLNPSRIRDRLTGLFQPRPADRESNPGFFPFRRPGITNAQTGRPAYQDEQYGGYYQNYPNQNGYNNVANPTDSKYPNYGQNVNFDSPNGNQYPLNYNYDNNQYPSNNPYPNDYYGNQYQPYNSNGNQHYEQNNSNDGAKDIPNDPVNFEGPTSTEVVIDPVKIVDNVEDPIDDAKNPPPILRPNPQQTGVNFGEADSPMFVSGTMEPPTGAVNYGDQNAVTKLPELTPVPDTGKRNNFNFGSAGIFQTCQTPDNGAGSCVSILHCDPYLKVVKESRTNPAAVQLLRSAHCGFEGNNPKVCCPRPGIPGRPSNPSTTTTTSTAAPATTHPPADPAQGKTAGDYLDKFPSPPVCGKANGHVSRVVGGDPAQLGAFPWMALLGYKPKRGGPGASWLCGGSLVSSRHVVTAAHCIHLLEERLFLVRLGELDLASETDGATPVDLLIKEKMKHEQYSTKTHANDIGVLILEKDVEFTALIKPICLPQEDEYRSQTFVDHSPMVAGWGSTEYRGPSASHLQVIQLPVVTNEQCAQAYSNYNVVHIDDSIICAGELRGGKDACQGDSGGPLMQTLYNATARTVYWYQIGVVSFGKKCAEPDFPGVYSRVTHFMPWLEEKILGRQLA